MSNSLKHLNNNLSKTNFLIFNIELSFNDYLFCITQINLMINFIN